jgi:hypothetical protein
MERLAGRLGREIMRIACEGDGIIDEDKVDGAHILAARGYLTITALDGGRYQVAVTKLAREFTRGNFRWQRFPRLNPQDVHALGAHPDEQT